MSKREISMPPWFSFIFLLISGLPQGMVPLVSQLMVTSGALNYSAVCDSETHDYRRHSAMQYAIRHFLFSKCLLGKISQHH